METDNSVLTNKIDELTQIAIEGMEFALRYHSQPQKQITKTVTYSVTKMNGKYTKKKDGIITINKRDIIPDYKIYTEYINFREKILNRNDNDMQQLIIMSYNDNKIDNTTE